MRPHTGPSLPRSLLEELEAADSKPGRKAAGRKLSRTESRKQERNQKKQRKAEFFSHHLAHGKRPAEEEHLDSPERKKAKLIPSHRLKTTSAINRQRSKAIDVPINGLPHPKPKGTVSCDLEFIQSSPNSSTKAKQKTALERLAERTQPGSTSSHPAASSLKRTSRVETEENAYIAYLEEKLGWMKGGKRTKKYGHGIDEDGLDDLLQGVDALEASIFSGEKSEHIHGDEASDDTVDDAEGEDMNENEEDEDSEDAQDDEDITDDESEEYDAEYNEDGDEVISAERKDDEKISDQDVEEWAGFGESTENEAAPVEGEEFEKPAGVRYVPPHLRNREAEKPEQLSEEQVKLTRHLKGLLNRLTEQNISTILDSLEDIYRKHRRHDVTSTLTVLIVDGISSHSMLLDSYVVLYAALVSSLHKLVGVEFAAYFVQNVVTSYERHFMSLQELSSQSTSDGEAAGGKECSNLIVLLSELYNFQVISCVLVYDILRGLLDGNLTEVKVELLLKIARNSGQQLRTDDPSTLKDLIQMVHSRLPAQRNEMSSRTRFMVETLTNLKNNKIRKDASTIASSSAVERMKKFLSGLSKNRQVKAHEPLRVGLEDLHSAEKKGKWWLVGAAWSGDPLVDRQGSQEGLKKAETTENILLKLARKQGMNTDIRRSIFVVLMSSEDYVDACERLTQLKLNEVQQREIVRVILHCCGNEKTYNPYYAFVGQQLCRTSHSYKITLQFSLWDFLRDLGETTVGGAEVLKNLNDNSVAFDLDKISSTRLRNVARAYAWWLAKDACTLMILKPVDFTVLKTQTQKFFDELFTHLLIDTQLSTPLLSSDPKDYPISRNRGPLEEVFIKATRVQTLALSLIYFLGERIRREAKGSSNNGFITWAAKVATNTLRTGVDVAAGL